MKQHRKEAMALLLMGMAICLTACVGQTARTKVLAPAMQKAWFGKDGGTGGIMEDALAGGAAEASVASFQQALNNQDWQLVGLLWPGIQTSAQKGITQQVADKTISEGVAVSLNERLRMFSLAINAQTQKAGQ